MASSANLLHSCGTEALCSPRIVSNKPPFHIFTETSQCCLSKALKALIWERPMGLAPSKKKKELVVNLKEFPVGRIWKGNLSLSLSNKQGHRWYTQKFSNELGIWPWASYLSPLGLSFLTCKMKGLLDGLQGPLPDGLFYDSINPELRCKIRNSLKKKQSATSRSLLPFFTFAKWVCSTHWEQRITL